VHYTAQSSQKFAPHHKKIRAVHCTSKLKKERCGAAPVKNLHRTAKKIGAVHCTSKLKRSCGVQLQSKICTAPQKNGAVHCTSKIKRSGAVQLLFSAEFCITTG
jgi:hypothetical protein